MLVLNSPNDIIYYESRKALLRCGTVHFIYRTAIVNLGTMMERIYTSAAPATAVEMFS